VIKAGRPRQEEAVSERAGVAREKAREEAKVKATQAKERLQETQKALESAQGKLRPAGLGHLLAGKSLSHSFSTGKKQCFLKGAWRTFLRTSAVDR